MASDPRTIRSIAVTAKDAVSAYEASERSAADPVLRVTPPFNGRMRARLHLGDPDDSGAIHISPADLFDPERLSSYPEPAETEAEIRADPELTYSTERHHERHVERVREWREKATEAFVDTVDIETPEGCHAIAVKVLGN